MLNAYSLTVAGIRLIDFKDTSSRVLLTLAAIGLVVGLHLIVVAAVKTSRHGQSNDRVLFWTRQGSSLAAFALIVLAIVSIWFDNAFRITSVSGVAAGLAISARRAVTAFVGYLVIVRGKAITVGDRIKMGGVRGDVIALGFLQTRILEMGKPPDVNEQEERGMWGPCSSVQLDQPDSARVLAAAHRQLARAHRPLPRTGARNS